MRDTDDPKLTDRLRKIGQASQHLLHVINDILDFSKIEANRMTLDAVDFHFGQIVENLSSLVSQKAAEKSLALQLDVPASLSHLPLRGDPLRLSQILINLVTNAIKFTDHGQIEVRVAPEASQLVIAVTDSGCGISADMLPHVFERFRQVDNFLTRRHQGTGLGLALVKELVELMGGEVSVSSVVEQGTVFVVRLPLTA